MKPEQTRIFQDRNGWQGETFIFDVNGYDWHIVTMSRQKGTITSSAQAGKHNEGKDFSGFEYVPFQDPMVPIFTEQGVATEATITAAHRKALVIFYASAENGILPQNQVDDSPMSSFSNDSDSNDSEDYWDRSEAWKGSQQADPDAWKYQEPAPMPFDPDFFAKNIAPIRGVAMNDETLRQGFQFTNDVTKGGTDWTEYQTDEFVRQMVDQFMADIMQRLKDEKPYVNKKPNEGYSGRRFEGMDYQRTRNMDISELAKLARLEYEAEFPEMKWSVKIERFSGGQAINANGTGYPENPYLPEFIEKAQKDGLSAAQERFRYNESRYTPQFLKDQQKAKDVLNRYNMDDSDSQTDYFHNRFYASVKIVLDDWDEKLFPERAKEVAMHRQWDAEWAEKRKAAAEKAAAQRKELGVLPKFAIAIYTATYRDIGEVVLPAVIVRSPNARSRGWHTYDIRIIPPPKHPRPGYRYKEFIERVNLNSVKLDEQATTLDFADYQARVAEIMGRKVDSNFEQYHGAGIRKAWKQLHKQPERIEPVKKAAAKPAAATIAKVDVGNMAMEMVKTVHTQKGFDLWVVKLADRVDKDTYTALNAEAKRLGGWYSSFRGAGAVPGFQFKSEDAARQFMGQGAATVPEDETIAIRARAAATALKLKLKLMQMKY